VSGWRGEGMRISYLLAAAVCVLGVSGCQVAPLSDGQITAIAAQARELSRSQNLSAHDACQNVVWQSQNYAATLMGQTEEGIKRCLNTWNATVASENQQRQAEAQLRQQDEQQRQQNDFNKRIADIKAGRASIQNAREATVIYHAADGTSLMRRPMLHPDNHNYVISGQIDPAGGFSGEGFIVKEAWSSADEMQLKMWAQIAGMTNLHEPAYASIMLNGSVPEGLRSGSTVRVVGTYTDNREYTTRDGSRHLMPVFTSKYIQAVDMEKVFGEMLQ